MSLPPTSTKGSGDTNPVTTFEIDFPNIPVTHTGTKASVGTVSVAGGGTGQITAAAAFNALSPITTTGDIIYSPSGATSQRLAIGSTGNVLTVSGGVPAWSPPASSSQLYGMDIINLGFSASVAASALTINVLSAAGNAPDASTNQVTVPFRSSTSATGTVTFRNITAAASITVPSGATLGSASATSTYAYLYLIDNGSTGIIGISLTRYDDGSIQSSTAINSSSSTSTVIYSNSSQASKPVRLAGVIKFTEATAGTWATAPSEITVWDHGVSRPNPYMYAHGSTTTITSSFADIVWTTTDNDNLNLFNGTTYTCPLPGRYAVNAKLVLTQTASVNSDNMEIEIVTSGGFTSLVIVVTDGINNSGRTLQVNDTIPNASAGDTIKIRANSSQTTPSIAAVTGGNTFSINYLGPS